MVPDQTAFLFYPKASIFTFLSKGPKSVQFDLMLVAKKIVNFLEEAVPTFSGRAMCRQTNYLNQRDTEEIQVPVGCLKEL